MDKQKIIGREYELKEMKRCVESNRSEFVVVYGRRRVGKTFLVDYFFDGQYDFSFVGGHKLKKAKQLSNFAKELKKAAGLKKQPLLSSWEDAFDALEEYLESLPRDRRKIVFIDEMPWIDTPKSEFVEALEYFWNSWGSRRNDIVFIATGSASSWMMDKLVENKGGLHARLTNNIYVRPFTLKETEEYLLDKGIIWDHYKILQTYMVMGGVPFYLSLLNPEEDLIANIDRLFFRKNGELATEFDELYDAIFTGAGKYLQIVDLLYKHKEGLIFDQIREITKIEGKRLTKLLRNLERCDFIVSFSQFGNKSKGKIFRLLDFYTLFYYKFLANNDSKDELWWTHNFSSPSVLSWQGRSFELVCLQHIPQIRFKLGISGISTSASSWRYLPNKNNSEESGAQIDLVIDRNDHTINICEMKFSVGMYSIKKEYEAKVRERMSLFQERTKTVKSIVSTFITTYGVVNAHSHSIVHKEIIAEDLFCV